MKYLRLFLFLFISPMAAGSSINEHSEQARLDYMQNCQGCHLADGQGLIGSVPSMKNHLDKFLSVPGGREFLVQVPGSANSPLNDLKLANLLNWLLVTMSEQPLADSFTAYTQAEVHKLRQSLLVDVTKIRADLVAQFPSE